MDLNEHRRRDRGPPVQLDNEHALLKIEHHELALVLVRIQQDVAVDQPDELLQASKVG